MLYKSVNQAISAGFPRELLDLQNWVCWRYVERDGRNTKVPYAPDGSTAKSNNAQTWTDYNTASSAKGFDGVGFMFDGEHIGIDIDHCINKETGEIDPEASSIVSRVDSYTEYSPSGEGLHIFCKGKLPGMGRRRGNVEVYGSGRYFTVTMHPFGDPRPMREASDDVAAVIADHIDAQKTNRKKPSRGNEDKAQASAQTTPAIIERIRQSKQGAKFDALWRGDTSSYGGDKSAADIALCNMLAFWTRKDAVQMDELFRKSGLMRNKWDEAHGPDTYGQMTIRRAIEDTTDVAPLTEGLPPLTISEEGSPFRRFEEVYSNIHDYPASKGVTYHVYESKGTTRRTPLAGFIALPIETITRDDGAETRQEFRIEGINQQGKYLPPITVASTRFNAMAWPMDGWGFDANIMPGQAGKDHLRYAIVEAGRRAAKARTIYTYTGWRKIEGQWAYLYNGGAVGVDGVSVELESALGMYSLPDCGGSMRPTLKMLEVLPHRVAIPLLGHVFLAPLREFLNEAGCTPAFTLFFAGTSGAKKSTAAALGLSHYGARFDGQHLPANFHDTANTLRQKAFTIKDAILIIDDLHPTSDPRERKLMDSTAQAMARAWGDLAERGRMRSDLTLQSSQAPRGLGMMTGEDLPDVGESGIARFFLVEIKHDDIKVGADLSDLQLRAANGELAASMRSYIEWLIPQTDTLSAKLGKAFRDYREEARKRLSGTHDRQPPAVAWLLVGYRMMLKCMVARNELTCDEADAMTREAWDVLTDEARSQKRDMAQSSPCKLFINTLAELEASGEVVINENRNGIYNDEYSSNHDKLVGYKDEHYIYLIATPAYSAVNTALKAGGRTFPLSQPRTWRRMAEEGYIETFDGGKINKTKDFNGKQPRVMFLKQTRVKQVVEE